MSSIAEAIAVAIQYHQAGRLDAAEQIYRQILAAEPQHADALHLLGVIASQRGQFEVAIHCLRRAIEIDPTEPGSYINLGNARVWVALSFVPEWRWLLDRGDSPWYPTMRLFRQRQPGDWPGVFAEIKEALVQRLTDENAGAGSR